MDIYDYIKMDHQKVNQLFKQFSKVASDQRKTEIAAMIARELLVHAKSEQETFYKALERHAAAKEDIQHARKEHKDIEDKIHAIMTPAKVTAKWQDAVKALQDLVEHHVKEEENTLFDEGKDRLTEGEACALKEKMHYLKQKLLIREFGV
ncbi:DNA nickase [Legionella rubrilucens]|uniref:DNA nickase n=1 Tax=Legionella rubrilucens TaxID=458 RepID=A0A0W0XMF8_9GAMM|nr:hemerythrin domain-containing protein [Legionella rubrilucens]KTD45603.1 DNA nickase [Legionella rubrilucens]